MKTYSLKFSVTETHTLELKKKPTKKQLDTLRKMSTGEMLADSVRAELSDLIYLELEHSVEDVTPEKYHWFELCEGDEKTLTYKG
jgi:hypothetical protein